MKIALVYFEQKLDDNRKHHNVNHFMLKGWQRFYEKSGTRAIPCLLLDEQTKCPDFWKYEHVFIKDSNPPVQLDVLNKVGWMKAQAHQYLGKCIVMDIDALLLKPIDELFDIKEKIAMAPDIYTPKTNWAWVKDWPEAIRKYNAGVLYLNSDEILNDFKNLWTLKEKYLNITYFDEIIFSSLTFTYGRIISENYNRTWTGEIDLDDKVIHFSGNRKTDLMNYLKNNIAVL